MPLAAICIEPFDAAQSGKSSPFLSGNFPPDNVVTRIQRKYATASGGLVVVRRYHTGEKTNGPAAYANLITYGLVKWLSVGCTFLKTRTRRGEDGKKIVTDVYEAEHAAARQKLSVYREQRAAWGRLIDKLTRQARTTQGG